MRRSKAARLIDDIRVTMVDTGDAESKVARISKLLKAASLPDLEVCDGDAHGNPHIDNCHQCAPRWGFVGAKEPVT